MKTIHLALTLANSSFHSTLTTSNFLIFPRHFLRNTNARSFPELPGGALPSSAALEKKSGERSKK